MKKLFSFLNVIVLANVAMVGQAAVINVQPVFAKYYNPNTFEEIFAPDLVPGQQVGVEVGIFMNIVSLDAGEDSFGTAAFSVVPIKFGGGTTLVPDVDAGGYAAFPHPTVDSNGPAPGGIVPLFATNADLGVDSQDYVGILVQAATGAFTNAADPRRNVGEQGSALGSPIQLGSAHFEWNATGAIKFILSPLEVSAKKTDGTFVAGTTPQVPEPSSIMLVMLGSLSFISRRRKG